MESNQKQLSTFCHETGKNCDCNCDFFQKAAYGGATKAKCLKDL